MKAIGFLMVFARDQFLVPESVDHGLKLWSTYDCFGKFLDDFLRNLSDRPALSKIILNVEHPLDSECWR